ncbi:hypothetical protein ACFQ46_14680 [Kineococcus sp. GCM10028916]|uniref:hypothetical protein n=1 Tax=Kineococcus sp. GCM10028916 TaxID=3273394 RepID=UPI00363E9B19
MAPPHDPPHRPPASVTAPAVVLLLAAGVPLALLVLASALPTLLVLATAAAVLAGGLDADDVAAYPGLTEAPGLGDHLRSVAWLDPALPLLCTALDSCASAASPGGRSSGRRRRCAGVVALVAALVGVALAGLAAWAWYAPPTAFQREQSAQPTEGAVIFVSSLQGGPWSDVAAVLVPALLAALAATVLLRPVSQQDRAFT